MEKTEEDKLKSEVSRLFNRNLGNLVSYVYVYNKNGYNKTIFRNFLGLNFKDFENGEELLKKAEEKLENKIKQFENLKEKIFSGKINLGEVNNYYKENISETIDFLENLIYIIEIEIQKIKKFNYKIDNNKLKEYIKKLDNFEKKFFGEKISENKDYSSAMIKELEKINTKMLTEKEKIFLKNILIKIKKETKTENYQPNEDKILVNIKDPLDNKNQEILSKMIKRKDYIKIFELTIDIIGLDKKVILDEDIGNIKVSADGIHIPTKENYEEIDIKGIIDLIAHEIETHMITGENNSNLVGEIKPIGYQAKEEGMASLFGKIASGVNVNKNKFSITDYGCLAGEILYGSELKEFLEILKKSLKSKINVEQRFLRLKRSRDFNLPGINPKDKAYFIGRQEVIKKINSQDNILKFFLGKYSLRMESEISKIAGVKEKFCFKILKKKNIVLPLMIGEIIRYKLIEKDDNTQSGFIEYFCKKYKNVLDFQETDYKDFIKEKIITGEENRKKIEKIIEIIEK